MFRILLIDDEPALLDIGKIYLAREGDFAVVTAVSGPEALASVAAEPFDAVVSDYEMPGMNGIELLKSLRAAGNPIPFVLFTGRGREEVAIEALNNGAAAYHKKGGESKSQFGELAHKVRQAVRQSRAEREIRESRQQLENLLSFLPDPTLAVDTGGRLIMWNRATAEMTGVPAGEVLGKDGYAYAAPFYGSPRPLLADLLLRPDEAALRGGYRVSERDGSHIIAECQVAVGGKKERVLWVKATLLYDGSGRVCGAVETIRDITERKRVIRLRRKAREELRRRNREIMETNTRLATAEQDLLGKNRELAAANQQMAAMEGELRLRLAALDESVQKLAAANRKLGLVSALALHGILSQLSVIQDSTDLLREQYGEGVPAACFSDQEAATEAIYQQILCFRDCLAIGTADPSWQNVGELASCVIAAAPAPALPCALETGDLEVYADPLLEKVFAILLGYSHTGGRHVSGIRLSFSNNGSGPILVWEDDGSSIATADKEQVFLAAGGDMPGTRFALAREILAITGMSIREGGIPGKGARFEIGIPPGCCRFPGNRPPAVKP